MFFIIFIFWFISPTWHEFITLFFFFLLKKPRYHFPPKKKEIFVPSPQGNVVSPFPLSPEESLHTHAREAQDF